MAETDTQTDLEAVQEDEAETITREYECAYLLVSTVPEEKVADEAQAVRTVIEKHSSAIVKEKQPEKMPLAYEMVVKRESKKERFTEAYFGWMTFETSSTAANAIHEELSRNPSLIRFMIIHASADQEPDVSDGSLISPQSEEEQELRGEVSEADIDKSIEALVGEEPDEKEAVPSA
ncbi:MAG: 30S ribosomal protein S6 [Candidatus Paceibacterota bacterium]